MEHYETIVLGAGAAGMMCAASLESRKNDALLVEGNARPGAKIAVSGGGRCNLTNLRVGPEHYRGDPEFVESVLWRFDQRSVLEWFRSRGLRPMVRNESQLFCPRSSGEILEIFERELSGVQRLMGAKVLEVEKREGGFWIETEKGSYASRRLVVATGGLSYPKLGATDLGLRIAERFGHEIVPCAPALVGLTLQSPQGFMKELSGISTEVEIGVGKRRFRGRLLFAHRGISGPAVLNASLWWERGEIEIDFLPDIDLESLRGSRKHLSSVLPVPKRALRALSIDRGLPDKPLYRYDSKEWERLMSLKGYRLAPAGTFGYARAEVTRGGVSTEEIDPWTLESRRVRGLYFIGEVLDVTGMLGGYNFQWAFSSAKACAEGIVAS